MRIKSGGGIAAAAIAVIVIAGGSAATISVVSSGSDTPSSSSVLAGPPATASVPASPSAGTNGSGAAEPGPATGTPAPSGTPSKTPAASGTVPGASPAVAALAAARAADEALPHSPQLLHDLAGPAGAGNAAAEPAASTANVPGIDVASFQHPNGAAINWTSVARIGYKFAAVKATEGNYYVNPYAVGDIAAAKAAGIDVTAYQFAIPNITSGATQAQFAVKYAKYATGPRMMPLMLDIEYDPYVSTDGTNECYGLSTGQMRTWISSFVSETHNLTHQYPIIYTTADWWDTCTGDSTAFGADPMWVAAYGVSSPPMPAGWKSWTFWQYASTGTVPGVSTPGNTDLSHFDTKMIGLIDPGTQSSTGGAKVGTQISSLAAVGKETLTFTATGLPPGLSITAAGDITGTLATPAAATSYQVTVTAKNSAGASGSATFTWKVAA